MRADNDKALFDRIAQDYARKDTHPSASIARKARLQQSMRPLLLPENSDVLEIGSGAGFSAEYLAGQYGSYTGLDYSSELTTYAQQLNAGPGRTFLCADAFQFEPEKEFDLIFAIGVLHHIEAYQDLLLRLSSFLRPGGWLMVNEPHPLNPIVTGARHLRKKFDSGYSEDQDELGPKAIGDAFEAAGLADVAISAQGFLATPLAEVPIDPLWLTRPIANFTSALDRGLAHVLPVSVGLRMSWNVVVTGRKHYPHT
ncbi:MAG: methyltransferase domain-containing protein [Pseudomonadales bacterium]|nr:methyltransferase domain-containing protein [Pseudomonadales bacterium]